jgi:YggT family protein
MLSQIGQLLVETISAFFVYLLLARFHFQWLRVPFRNPFGEFIVAVTNWIVLPLRRVIPGVAGLDLASLLAAWVIQGIALWALFALRGGDAGASPEMALAIALVAAVDLLRLSLHILVFALIVQAVLSWVSPYHPLQPVFDVLTRPFLRPIRRVLPPIGNVDLSPLVLIILVQVALIPLGQLSRLAASAG